MYYDLKVEHFDFSMALDTIPFVGTVKGIQEVLTGVDLVTGQQLSVADRVAEGAGVLLSVLPEGKLWGTLAAKEAIDGGEWVWKQVGKEAVEETVDVAKKQGTRLKLNLQLFAGTKDDVPSGLGIVQSRINVANGRTRFTPMRDTGEPVSAGFNHILEGHFNRPLANSRSVFSISAEELKSILQSPDVVESTVKDIGGGQFTRVVDVGEIIGHSALKYGGHETTWIKIFTDKAGNIITAYPIPEP